MSLSWRPALSPHVSQQPAVSGRLGVLEYEIALAAQRPLLIAHQGQSLASAAPAGEPGAL